MPNADSPAAIALEGAARHLPLAGQVRARCFAEVTPAMLRDAGTAAALGRLAQIASAFFWLDHRADGLADVVAIAANPWRWKEISRYEPALVSDWRSA